MGKAVEGRARHARAAVAFRRKKVYVDFDKVIAIDVHTHAEVSCWNPYDKYGEEYDRCPPQKLDYVVAASRAYS